MSEKIMNKVARLLEQANHPNTGKEEREAFLAKADEMMQKYALDMAMLEVSMSRDDRRKPIRKNVEQMIAGKYSFQQTLRTILNYLAEANRCRAAFYTNGDVELFGVHEDVLYVELVWANINYDFLSKIDPQWNNDLPFDQNVYNLVKAGKKWKDIAARAGIDFPDGGRLKRAYHRWQKNLGEEHTSHTTAHAAYVDEFVDSYRTAVVVRLIRMQDKMKDDTKGTGADLVLSDLSQAVSALYFEAFPQYSPEEVAKRRKARQEEQDRIDALEAERWASLTDAQRAKETAAKEREAIRRAKLDNDYWEREYRRRERGSAGRRAGRAAGEAVKITKERETTGSDMKGLS